MGAHAIPIRTASDESLEETIGAPGHRKWKNKAVLDSEDDTRPRKRKLIKGIRPPTPEEDDDILDAGNRQYRLITFYPLMTRILRSARKSSAFSRKDDCISEELGKAQE